MINDIKKIKVFNIDNKPFLYHLKSSLESLLNATFTLPTYRDNYST